MTFPSTGLYPGVGLFPGDAPGPPIGTTSKLITLGPVQFVDQAGVRFRGMRLEGWDGGVGSNLALTQKPRAPGAWRSVSPQRTPRTPVLSGMVATDTPALMLATMDAINAAATLDPSKLSVNANGAVRWAMVSQQADIAVTQYPSALLKAFSLQLVAADPRKFADPLTGATSLPSSTGGFTFPFTFPLTIASTVVAGAVSLTNPGNTAGPVLLRIDGPVTGPVVTHVGSGAALVFSSSLTLGVGEFLIVDMENHTVLANGTASRSGYVTVRGWSQFDPGVNVWGFTALTFNPAAQLTVTATPSWL